MKKKIVSIFVSGLIVIVSSVLLAFGLLMLVQNRNKVETGNILGVSWYNETESEFVITTTEQLFELAELSEFYNFDRQIIKLGADIVINEGNAEEWAEKAPSKKWIPIKEFKGTFDGQGHSISGLYGKGFDAPIALFIKVDTSATIQNFKLLNSYFQTSGESGTASFAAYGGGKYIKLYSDAIIDCEGDHAGGIASHIDAQSTFEECWFDGTINITGRDSGGIVDEITKGRVNIKHCLFSGIINSEYTVGAAKIGGLCGNVAKEGTLVLTDSLASGTVNAKNSVYTGGFLGVGYAGTNVTVYDSYVSDATYSSVLGSSGKGGTFVGNAIDLQEKNLIGYESYRWTTLDFEKYWAVVLEDTPILKCFATDIPSLEGIEKAYDISWYTADGTVFTISTVPQFYGFQMLSSSKGFAGKTVKLGADITLNTGNAKDWEKNAPELSWRPIQNFDGTFDGQGHTISGIYYKDTSNASSFRGLFGLTAVSARIKNFRLVNSYFERTNEEVINGMMGSIVGDLRGSLDSVYSNAIVKCNGTQVGGLVGRANGVKQPIGNATVNITNCWYDGELYMMGKKATNAGGIVGIAVQGNVNILHCLNTGTLSSEVTGTGVHLGGILGGDWSIAKIAITDCLNVGELKVQYTAAIGSVLARARSGKTVVTITDTYATKESYKTAVSTDGLNGTINGGVMQFAKDKLIGNGGYAYTTLDFKDYWTIVKDGTPVLKSFANTTTSVAGLKKAFDISWYKADAKEMVIDSVEDLYGFAFLSSMNNFKGQTIKLGADITVNKGKAEEWGTNPPAKEWYTIGNSISKFAGSFDGQGHTISGIYYKDAPGNNGYGGLFGMTDVGSKVSNFRLENSYFERSGSLGSIAGDLRGDLDSVYSNAIVVSDSTQVGGLVGRANGVKKEKGNETVTISNCWYDGKLHMNDETTARYAGGIAGVAIQGNINILHCLNTGELTSDVVDTGVHLGGILGSDWSAANVKIADCLSTGKLNVNWTAAIGSVVGRVKTAKSVVTIENTFATYESYPTAVSTSGLYGTVNGSVMQFSEDMILGYDGYRFTSLDFNKYWAVVEDGTPILQKFAKKVPSVANVERLFDIKWYSKDAKKMVVDTVAELYGVYFMSANTDFAGQTIELGKDITVNTGAMSGWENEWFPIGNASKRFAGTFDGKGHTISGIYVTPDSAGANYGGLFGGVAPKGVVTNFKLQNSYIETTGNEAGSVVGELRGTLSKVKSTATVKSSVNKMGGLVGRASVSANINDSWFDGKVIMACEEGYAGGIVGAAVTGTVSIKHCLNTGDITMAPANTALYAGGFVGTDWAVVAIEIEDCLNVGPLTESGHAQAASILGTFRSRTSSISMTNTYATKEESQLTVGATMGTISGNAITYDAELLKGYGGYQYTTLDFSPDTGYWAVVTDSTPILKSFATTVPSIGADVERKIDVSWFDEKDETLELDSAADLFGFSCIASYYDFNGQTIELKKDIVLNEGKATDWELGNNVPAVSWTPIGNLAVPFRGEFQGNKYSISGLYLKDTSTTSNFTGLFGVTAPGSTVENFQLRNSYIERKGNASVYGTGSIVGLSHGDLVRVYSDAIVKVDGTIQSGGLIGRSASNHNITNCWFDGKLVMCNGATYAGGILGIVFKSTITMTNTLFTGTIISDVTGGYPSIGGLVGTDHEAGNATVIMTNCISAGDMQVKKLLSVGTVLGAYYAGNSSFEMTNVYGVLSYDQSNVKIPALGRLRGGYTDGTPIEVSKLDLSGYNIYTCSDVNIDLESTWAARKDNVVALRYFAGKVFKASDIVECNTEWYTGESSTYEISTADEFYGLMLLSHQGEDFNGELIRLTDNIALNTIQAETLNSWKNGTQTFVNKWIPIGSTSFKGSFDGGEHTIRGLYLKTDKSNVGMFGNLNGGTISNLRLTDSYLENTASGVTENLGSIVGKASGELKNVYSEAIVKGAGSGVGGLVGAATSPSLRITSCWYHGEATVVNVVKAAYFGGLLGHVTSGTVTIDTSLFTGNMSYTLMCPESTWGTINAGIGGFCGADRGYPLIVNNSVSAGKVFATWDQEGAAGTTSANSFQRITGILGNSGCANNGTNGKIYDATVVNVKVKNKGTNKTFTKSYEGNYTFTTQTMELNALKNATTTELNLLKFDREAGDTTTPIWYKESGYVPVPETLKSMIRKEGQ